MNPADFRSLVKNYTALTSEEYAALRDLATKYPYSQVLHVLEARTSKDLKLTEHGSLLNQAAIYATDRAIVKKSLTAPVLPRQAPAEATPVTKDKTVVEKSIDTRTAAKDQVKPVEKKPATAVDQSSPTVAEKVAAKLSAKMATEQVPKEESVAKPKVENPLEGDALRSDLVNELNKLQKLKHAFEASYDALHKAAGTEKKKQPVEAPLKDVGTREPEIIEEIKTTRKKIKVPSPKVVEQNEIIDQFIKVQPSMPKPKSGDSSEDLAEESGSFSDNIVSETLVSILLKQGKKAKAIEMLKKLIWKFPQKKAYFAAQIEELKN